MFTTKDVNRQRVREQDYQEARNDFNKSARHDLMVKNMMDSEDRTMQKRWMQQRYEVRIYAHWYICRRPPSLKLQALDKAHFRSKWNTKE